MLLGIAIVNALVIVAIGAGMSAAEVGLAEPRPRMTATVSSPVARLVRVRVTIATTSDWTQVRLVPGRVVATKVVSQTAGVSDVIALHNGWQLRSSVPGNTLVVDAVYAEGTDAPKISLRIQKGWLGATKVDVVNTTAWPTRVLTATDRRRDGTDPGYPVVATAARPTFMRRSPLELEKADDRRLTLAVLYPWWFGAGYSDEALADRPVQSGRSATSSPGILSMTQQARANGVDGFLISFAGRKANGAALTHALDAAAVVGGVAAPYLETAAATAVPGGPPEAAIVRRWVREALVDAGKPAYLKTNGVPIVFVYQMHLLPAATWSAIATELAASGSPVRFVGEAPLPAYKDAAWGVHRYDATDPLAELASRSVRTGQDARAMSALDRNVPPTLFAATVSPGFDDRALRGEDRPLVDRDGGARYAGTWDAAVSGDPDWIVITSWNEWWEATSIEPSIEGGDTALRQTSERAAAWKAGR